MPTPGEHKTVQARILAYAQEIGWTYVSRAEAEARRGFDPDGATPEDRARTASLYFGDLLHAQVRAFNPKYKEAEGALVGEFQRLQRGHRRQPRFPHLPAQPGQVLLRRGEPGAGPDAH